MVKVEVIKEFILGRFDELKNIQRRRIEEKGKLFVGDTFECSEELAEYLMGSNAKGDVVVKVIEIIPEKKEEQVIMGTIKYTSESVEPKAKFKPSRKKKSKKEV